MCTIPFFLTMLACTERSTSWEESFPAPGMSALAIESERGLVSYDGAGPADAVDATITSWARGSSAGHAARKVEANAWELIYGGVTLQGAVVAAGPKAGVDLELAGPAEVDAEIIVYDGDAELSNLHGIQRVTADRIVATNVSGELDLFAGKHGMEVEVDPDPATFNVFQSFGDDLILRLPKDGNFTLEGFVDAQFGFYLGNFEFLEAYGAVDYVFVVNGTGETLIQVMVEDGGFYLFTSDDDAGDDTDTDTGDEEIPEGPL